MVELQALGAVRGQKQQSALPAAHLPPPLRQPFEEVGLGHLRAAGFQGEFIGGFLQQFEPRAGGLLGQPLPQRCAIDDVGFALAQPIAQGLGLAQAPKIGKWLIAHLHGNSVLFAPSPHRRQILPFAGDDGAS